MAMKAIAEMVGQRGGVRLFATQGAPTVVRSTGTIQLVASLSLDSGIRMPEVIGMARYGFQVLGTGTGFSVSFYGTISPVIQEYIDENPGLITSANVIGNTSIVPASDWALLSGPSTQSGTGQEANPLTQTGVIFVSNMVGLVAVRAVISTGASGFAGSITPVCFATK